MSQPDIKDLFDESRFPSGWKLLSLLLYTPFGLLLVILRLLICLILWLLATTFPDCQILRSLLRSGATFAFGLVLKLDPNGEKRDRQTRMIVANSVSALDDLALAAAADTLTPSLSNLPDSLSYAMGLQKMDMSSKEALVAEIKQFLPRSESGVALQPEFSATNCRKALLKFNTWPFGVTNEVQPVVLEAYRPDLVDVKLTSIASTWWTDAMWFMFVPYTVFGVRFLKVRRDERAEVLVREVEREIARVLGIETSGHTVADKSEYEKRYIREKIHNRPRLEVNSGADGRAAGGGVGGAAGGAVSAEMQRMARQVSEVLPLVPQSVIIRDLMKTRNADVTITNILDGIVTYTPEPQPVSTPASGGSGSSTSGGASPGGSSSGSGSRSPATTPKSSSPGGATATLTFQEKKEKMIAEARERYMLKHGLKDCC